jgi:hypothetical protein
MSTATTRSAGTAARDEEGSTVWFWLIVVAVLALIVFLIAWLGGWIRFTTDPRIVEIREMQEEARAKYAAAGGPATLAEATAAVAAMTAIRQKIDALPAYLQPQVERSGGAMMRDMFRGRMDSYFAAASPQQRQAELDRQIDQEEVMRKAFEAGRAVASVAGAGRRGGEGGGSSRGRTQDDSNRWRKNMIDRTSPEDRARYTEYRRAMEERREKRGLPSGSPR